MSVTATHRIRAAAARVVGDIGRRFMGGDRMVVQLVRASIKPDRREHALEVIARNAAATRAEEGCQGCQVAEDLERPPSFVIVELWTDLDAVYTQRRRVRRAPEASIHEVATTLTLAQVLAAAGIAR